MDTIYNIALLMALTGLLVFIFKVLNLSTVLAYLTTGIIAGLVLGQGSDYSHVIEIMGEIGIILLLFSIGMEFSFREIAKLKREVLVAGTLQIFVTAVVFLPLTMLFGLSGVVAGIISVGIALSSSAMLFKIISQSKQQHTPFGRTTIGILIMQDVASVFLLSFIPIYFESDGLLGMGFVLLKAIILVVVVYFMGRYVIPFLLLTVAKKRDPEMFIMSILGLCAVIVVASLALELPNTFGAFIAGMVLADTDFAHEAGADILAIKDLMIAFFFIFIGLSLDINFIVDNVGIVLISLPIVYFLKFVVIAVVAFLIGLPLASSLRVGLLMGQLSEFFLVILTLTNVYHPINPAIHSFLVTLALSGFFVTPFIASLAAKIEERMELSDLKGIWAHGLYAKSIDNPDYEHLHDHIIIVGYGPTGQMLARAAKGFGMTYVITETNPETVKRYRSTEPIIYGDARKKGVLKHLRACDALGISISVPDAGITKDIILAAKSMNEDIYVITKSTSKGVAEGMLDVGASHVIVSDDLVGYDMIYHMFSVKGIAEKSKARISKRVLDKHISKEAVNNTLELSIDNLLERYEVELPNSYFAIVHTEHYGMLVGKTLREMLLEERPAVTVHIVAIIRGNSLIPMPKHDNVVEEADRIVMGTSLPTERVLGIYARTFAV